MGADMTVKCTNDTNAVMDDIDEDGAVQAAELMEHISEIKRILRENECRALSLKLVEALELSVEGAPTAKVLGRLIGERRDRQEKARQT
jgi:hypothetical protein